MDHEKCANIRINNADKQPRIKTEDGTGVKISSFIIYLDCLKCVTCANHSDFSDNKNCASCTNFAAIVNLTDDKNCSNNINNEDGIDSTNKIIGKNDVNFFQLG